MSKDGAVGNTGTGVTSYGRLPTDGGRVPPVLRRLLSLDTLHVVRRAVLCLSSAYSAMSERDPLLDPASAALPPAVGESASAAPPGLGPLEITRRTRYGILAGIWVGNFLSVSSYLPRV